MELELLFGLPDDPDNSEDDCEGTDDVEACTSLLAVLENPKSILFDLCVDQHLEVDDFTQPGPSGTSIRYPTGLPSFISSNVLIENRNPNVGISSSDPNDNEDIFEPGINEEEDTSVIHPGVSNLTQ